MKLLIFLLMTVPLWGQQDTTKIEAFSIELGENTRAELRDLQRQILEADNQMKKIIGYLKEANRIPWEKYYWRWKDEKMEEIIIIEKKDK